MTTTVAVNQNNDLFIGPDGRLALVSGIEAVLQAAQQAAQTQLGEKIYATDEGLPNFTALWGGAPNLPQWRAYLRRTLLAVPDVIGLADLEVVRAGDVVRYSVTINTIYGAGAVNG